MDQFRKVYELNQSTKKDLDSLIKALNELKDKLYTPELKEIESNSILHEDGRITFTDRWKLVSNLAHRYNIGYKQYSNLSKLVESLKLEKDINFNTANKERDQLIDELSKKLDKEQLEDLVLKSLAFKTNKITQSEYYTYLQGLANKTNIDPIPYRNLINYTEYITIYESIDLLEIFNEVKAYEDQIIEKLYTTEEQKKLHDVSKCVNCIKGLFNLKLTNTDFEYLEKHVKSCKTDLSNLRGSTYEVERVFDNLDIAMDFYRTAELRNRAILANTIKQMDAEGTEVAALITGGYHTKGLSDILKRKQTSYLVILPKFDASKGQRPYVAILTNKNDNYSERVNAFFKEIVKTTLDKAYKDGKDIPSLKNAWIESYESSYEKLVKEDVAYSGRGRLNVPYDAGKSTHGDRLPMTPVPGASGDDTIALGTDFPADELVPPPVAREIIYGYDPAAGETQETPAPEVEEAPKTQPKPSDGSTLYSTPPQLFLNVKLWLAVGLPVFALFAPAIFGPVAGNLIGMVAVLGFGAYLIYKTWTALMLPIGRYGTKLTATFPPLFEWEPVEKAPHSLIRNLSRVGTLILAFVMNSASKANPPAPKLTSTPPAAAQKAEAEKVPAAQGQTPAAALKQDQAVSRPQEFVVPQNTAYGEMIRVAQPPDTHDQYRLYNRSILDGAGRTVGFEKIKAYIRPTATSHGSGMSSIDNRFTGTPEIIERVYYGSPRVLAGYSDGPESKVFTVTLKYNDKGAEIGYILAVNNGNGPYILSDNNYADTDRMKNMRNLTPTLRSKVDRRAIEPSVKLLTAVLDKYYPEEMKGVGYKVSLEDWVEIWARVCENARLTDKEAGVHIAGVSNWLDKNIISGLRSRALDKAVGGALDPGNTYPLELLYNMLYDSIPYEDTWKIKEPFPNLMSILMLAHRAALRERSLSFEEKALNGKYGKARDRVEKSVAYILDLLAELKKKENDYRARSELTRCALLMLGDLYQLNDWEAEMGRTSVRGLVERLFKDKRLGYRGDSVEPKPIRYQRYPAWPCITPDSAPAVSYDDLYYTDSWPFDTFYRFFTAQDILLSRDNPQDAGRIDAVTSSLETLRPVLNGNFGDYGAMPLDKILQLPEGKMAGSYAALVTLIRYYVPMKIVSGNGENTPLAINAKICLELDRLFKALKIILEYNRAGGACIGDMSAEEINKIIERTVKNKKWTECFNKTVEIEKKLRADDASKDIVYESLYYAANRGKLYVGMDKDESGKSVKVVYIAVTDNNLGPVVKLIYGNETEPREIWKGAFDEEAWLRGEARPIKGWIFEKPKAAPVPHTGGIRLELPQMPVAAAQAGHTRVINIPPGSMSREFEQYDAGAKVIKHGIAYFYKGRRVLNIIQKNMARPEIPVEEVALVDIEHFDARGGISRIETLYGIKIDFNNHAGPLAGYAEPRLAEYVDFKYNPDGTRTMTKTGIDLLTGAFNYFEEFNETKADENGMRDMIDKTVHDSSSRDNYVEIQRYKKTGAVITETRWHKWRNNPTRPLSMTVYDCGKKDSNGEIIWDRVLYRNFEDNSWMKALKPEIIGGEEFPVEIGRDKKGRTYEYRRGVVRYRYVSGGVYLLDFDSSISSSAKGVRIEAGKAAAGGFSALPVSDSTMNGAKTASDNEWAADRAGFDGKTFTFPDAYQGRHTYELPVPEARYKYTVTRDFDREKRAIITTGVERTVMYEKDRLLFKVSTDLIKGETEVIRLYKSKEVNGVTYNNVYETLLYDKSGKEIFRKYHKITFDRRYRDRDIWTFLWSKGEVRDKVHNYKDNTDRLVVYLQTKEIKLTPESTRIVTETKEWTDNETGLSHFVKIITTKDMFGNVIKIDSEWRAKDPKKGDIWSDMGKPMEYYYEIITAETKELKRNGSAAAVVYSDAEGNLFANFAKGPHGRPRNGVAIPKGARWIVQTKRDTVRREESFGIYDAYAKPVYQDIDTGYFGNGFVNQVLIYDPENSTMEEHALFREKDEDRGTDREIDILDKHSTKVTYHNSEIADTWLLLSEISKKRMYWTEYEYDIDRALSRSYAGDKPVRSRTYDLLLPEGRKSNKMEKGALIENMAYIYDGRSQSRLIIDLSDRRGPDGAKIAPEEPFREGEVVTGLITPLDIETLWREAEEFETQKWRAPIIIGKDGAVWIDTVKGSLVVYRVRLDPNLYVTVHLEKGPAGKYSVKKAYIGRGVYEFYGVHGKRRVRELFSIDEKFININPGTGSCEVDRDTGYAVIINPETKKSVKVDITKDLGDMAPAMYLYDAADPSLAYCIPLTGSDFENGYFYLNRMLLAGGNKPMARLKLVPGSGNTRQDFAKIQEKVRSDKPSAEVTGLPGGFARVDWIYATPEPPASYRDTGLPTVVAITGIEQGIKAGRTKLYASPIDENTQEISKSLGTRYLVRNKSARRMSLNTQGIEKIGSLKNARTAGGVPISAFSGVQTMPVEEDVHWEKTDVTEENILPLSQETGEHLTLNDKGSKVVQYYTPDDRRLKTEYEIGTSKNAMNLVLGALSGLKDPIFKSKADIEILDCIYTTARTNSLNSIKKLREFIINAIAVKDAFEKVTGKVPVTAESAGNILYYTRALMIGDPLTGEIAVRTADDMKSFESNLAALSDAVLKAFKNFDKEAKTQKMRDFIGFDTDEGKFVLGKLVHWAKNKKDFVFEDFLASFNGIIRYEKEVNDYFKARYATAAQEGKAAKLPAQSRFEIFADKITSFASQTAGLSSGDKKTFLEVQTERLDKKDYKKTQEKIKAKTRFAPALKWLGLPAVIFALMGNAGYAADIAAKPIANVIDIPGDIIGIFTHAPYFSLAVAGILIAALIWRIYKTGIDENRYWSTRQQLYAWKTPPRQGQPLCNPNPAYARMWDEMGAGIAEMRRAMWDIYRTLEPFRVMFYEPNSPLYGRDTGPHIPAYRYGPWTFLTFAAGAGLTVVNIWKAAQTGLSIGYGPWIWILGAGLMLLSLINGYKFIADMALIISPSLRQRRRMLALQIMESEIAVQRRYFTSLINSGGYGFTADQWRELLKFPAHVPFGEPDDQKEIRTQYISFMEYLDYCDEWVKFLKERKDYRVFARLQYPPDQQRHDVMPTFYTQGPEYYMAHTPGIAPITTIMPGNEQDHPGYPIIGEADARNGFRRYANTTRLPIPQLGRVRNPYADPVEPLVPLNNIYVYLAHIRERARQANALGNIGLVTEREEVVAELSIGAVSGRYGPGPESTSYPKLFWKRHLWHSMIFLGVAAAITKAAYGFRLHLAALKIAEDMPIMTPMAFTSAEIIAAVIGFLTIVGIFKYLLFGAASAERPRRIMALGALGGIGYFLYSYCSEPIIKIARLFDRILPDSAHNIFDYLAQPQVLPYTIIVLGAAAAIIGIYYLVVSSGEQSNEVRDQDILDHTPDHLLRGILNRAIQDAINEGKDRNLPGIVRNRPAGRRLIGDNEDVRAIFREISGSYKGLSKASRLVRNEPLSDWITYRIRMSSRTGEGHALASVMEVADIVNNVRERGRIIQVLAAHGFNVQGLPADPPVDRRSGRATNMDIAERLTLADMDRIVNDPAIAHEIFEAVVLMDTVFGNAAAQVRATLESATNSYHGRVDIALSMDDDDPGVDAIRQAMQPGGILAPYADNIIIYTGSNWGSNLGKNQRKARMKPVLDVETVKYLKKIYGERRAACPDYKLPGFVELVDQEDRLGALLLKSKTLLWKMYDRTVSDEIAGRRNSGDRRRWGIKFNGLGGAQWKLRLTYYLTTARLRIAAWGAAPDADGDARERAAFMLNAFRQVYANADYFAESEFRTRSVPAIIQSELRLVSDKSPAHAYMSHSDYLLWHTKIQVGQTNNGFLFLGGTGNGFLWDMIAGEELDGSGRALCYLNDRARLQDMLFPLRQNIEREETRMAEFYAGFPLPIRLMFHIIVHPIRSIFDPSVKRTRVPSGLLRNYLNTYNISGAWDLYNIIEDSELGRRLPLYQLKATRLVGPFTQILEDLLPVMGAPWWRQRSRWIIMQTFAVTIAHPAAFFMFFGQYIGLALGWMMFGSANGFILQGLGAGLAGFVIGGFAFYYIGHIVNGLLILAGWKRNAQWQVDPVKAMGYWRFQHVAHLAAATPAVVATTLTLILTILYGIATVGNVPGLEFMGGGLGAFIVDAVRFLQVYVPFVNGWLPTVFIGAIVFFIPPFMQVIQGMIATLQYDIQDEESTTESIRVYLTEAGDTPMIGIADMHADTINTNIVVPGRVIAGHYSRFSDDEFVINFLNMYIREAAAACNHAVVGMPNNAFGWADLNRNWRNGLDPANPDHIQIYRRALTEAIDFAHGLITKIRGDVRFSWKFFAFGAALFIVSNYLMSTGWFYAALGNYALWTGLAIMIAAILTQVVSRVPRARKSIYRLSSIGRRPYHAYHYFIRQILMLPYYMNLIIAGILSLFMTVDRYQGENFWTRGRQGLQPPRYGERGSLRQYRNILSNWLSTNWLILALLFVPIYIIVGDPMVKVHLKPKMIGRQITLEIEREYQNHISGDYNLDSSEIYGILRSDPYIYVQNGWVEGKIKVFDEYLANHIRSGNAESLKSAETTLAWIVEGIRAGQDYIKSEGGDDAEAIKGFEELAEIFFALCAKYNILDLYYQVLPAKPEVIDAAKFKIETDNAEARITKTGKDGSFELKCSIDGNVSGNAGYVIVKADLPDSVDMAGKEFIVDYGISGGQIGNRTIQSMVIDGNGNTYFNPLSNKLLKDSASVRPEKQPAEQWLSEKDRSRVFNRQNIRTVLIKIGGNAAGDCPNLVIRFGAPRIQIRPSFVTGIGSPDIKSSMNRAVEQRAGKAKKARNLEPVRPLGILTGGLAVGSLIGLGIITLLNTHAGANINPWLSLGIGLGLSIAGFIIEASRHSRARMNKHNVDSIRKSQAGFMYPNGWAKFGDFDEFAALKPVLEYLGIPEDMVRPYTWTAAEMPTNWLTAFMELFKTSPPRIATVKTEIDDEGNVRKYIEITPSLLLPGNELYLEQILRHEFAHLGGAGEIGATWAERGLLRTIYNIPPLVMDALLPGEEAGVFNIPAPELLEKFNHGFLLKHVGRATVISMRIGRELGLSEEEMKLLEYASALHDVGGDPRALNEKKFSEYSERIKQAADEKSIKKAADKLVERAASSMGIAVPEDIGARYELFKTGLAAIARLSRHEIAQNEELLNSIFDVPSNTLKILRKNNIVISPDLEVLLKYHADYAGFVKDKPAFSIPADRMRMLLSILYLTDMFEHGNNRFTQLVQRGKDRVENFPETFTFIEGMFAAAGMLERCNREPVDALVKLVRAEDPAIMKAVTAARETVEAGEAAKICETFNRANIIPSFTLNASRDFKDQESDFRKGLEVLRAIFTGSSVTTQYSFEDQCRDERELARIKSTPEYRADKRTFHLKILNDKRRIVDGKPKRYELNLSSPDTKELIENKGSVLYQIVEELQPEYVSVHISAPMEEREFGTDDRPYEVGISPLLSREEVLNRFVDRINTLQDNLKTIGHNNPVLVESLDYHDAALTKGAYEYITEPAFIREVLARTGAHFLADCAHMYVSAKNTHLGRPDYDYMEYVKQIIDEDTIALVDEAHLTVPAYDAKTGQWQDVHLPFYTDSVEAGDVKNILRYIFELRAKKGITKPIIVNFESDSNETDMKNSQKDITALADFFRPHQNARMAMEYESMKDLSNPFDAVKMQKSRGLFEWDDAAGAWDWKQGDGITLLLGLPFEGPIQQNMGEIENALSSLEPDAKKLYLMKIENFHLTAAALTENTLEVSQDPAVEKEILRRLSAVRSLIQGQGAVKLKFHYKDLTITPGGEIVALGFVENDNLFAIRDKLHFRGISSHYTDIVHMTIGRIFDENISPERLAEYKRLIEALREKKDERGNPAVLADLTIDNANLWDQRGATSELRYGRSHSPIPLEARPEIQPNAPPIVVKTAPQVTIESFTSERGPSTAMAVARLKASEVTVYPVFQRNIKSSRGMQRDRATMHFGYQLEGGKFQDVDDEAPDYEHVRKDIWTIEEHLAEFRKKHPDVEIIGFVGNGNILANTGLSASVMWVERKLWATEQEKELIYNGNSRNYPSLILWKENGRYSAEEVKFTREGRIIQASTDKDITEDVIFTNSGVGLLKQGPGRETAPYDLAAHCWHDSDVRHYLDFPFRKTNTGKYIHFGVDQFYDSKGNVVTALLSPAIDEEPITLKLEENKIPLDNYDIVALEAGLKEKGYEPAASRDEVAYGSYFIAQDLGEIKIGFFRGINPHNICGVDSKGNLIWVIVSGKSNRIGITFKEAQKKLKEMGAASAVIFDNGADAMMNIDNSYVIPSFQGRDRILSILVFGKRAPPDTRPQAPAEADFAAAKFEDVTLKDGSKFSLAYLPWRGKYKAAAAQVLEKRPDKTRPISPYDHDKAICPLCSPIIADEKAYNGEGRQYIIVVNTSPFAEDHALFASREPLPQIITTPKQIEDIAGYMSEKGEGREAIFNGFDPNRTSLAHRHYHWQVFKRSSTIWENYAKGVLNTRYSEEESTKTVRVEYSANKAFSVKIVIGTDIKKISEILLKDIRVIESKSLIPMINFRIIDGKYAFALQAGTEERPASLVRLDEESHAGIGAAEHSGYIITDTEKLFDTLKDSPELIKNILIDSQAPIEEVLGSADTNPPALPGTRGLEPVEGPAQAIKQFNDMASGIMDRGYAPIIVADLDGTITEPNEPISEENARAIIRLVKSGAIFAVLSGISFNRVKYQFLEPMVSYLTTPEERDILKGIPIASDNGTQVYQYDTEAGGFECVWAKDMAEVLGKDRYSRAVQVLNRCADELNIRQMLGKVMNREFDDEDWQEFRRDHIIDKRKVKIGKDHDYKNIVTQISFMVVGNEASPEEKDLFSEADKGVEAVIRNPYAEYIKEELRKEGIELEVTVSGKSSIDITLPGADKGSGIMTIAGRLRASRDIMIFFGDAFRANDGPALKSVKRAVNFGQAVDFKRLPYDTEGLESAQFPGTGPRGFRLLADKLARRLEEHKREPVTGKKLINGPAEIAVLVPAKLEKAAINALEPGAIVTKDREIFDELTGTGTPGIILTEGMTESYLGSDNFRLSVQAIQAIAADKNGEKLRRFVNFLKKKLQLMDRFDIDTARQKLLSAGEGVSMYTKRINAILPALLREQQARLAMAYSTMSLPEAQFNNQVVVATTDTIAENDIYFFDRIIKASEKGIVSPIIYGDRLKTPEEAAAFARAGLRVQGISEGRIDEAMKSIIFVDKYLRKDDGSNAPKSRNDIVMEIQREVFKSFGTTPDLYNDIGIRAIEGELQEGRETPLLGKLVEIKPVTINGEKVYVSINTYEITLEVVTKLKGTMTLEGLAIPGLKIDERGRIIFTSPIVPYDYNKEIGAYRDAIALLASAA
ncbi:MAG: DUF692 family multinuclear iron-containing protein [Candidatus Omnitrophota bacterium]